MEDWKNNMKNISKIAVLTYLSLAPLATLKSSSCVAKKSQEEQDYQDDLESTHQIADPGDKGRIVRKLLASKKSIKKMDADEALLVYFCYQDNPTTNQPSTIRFLLSAKADVNKIDARSGMTALMVAAYHRSAEIPELLLAAKANPNLKSTYGGYTALMRATMAGIKPSYALLLAAGADPFPKNQDGESALSFAKKAGHGQRTYKLTVTHLVHTLINPHQDANIAKIIASYVTTLELAHQVRIALDLNQNDDLDDNDLSKTIASYVRLEE